MEPKVALITGASSGIGLALAERLLQKHPNMHICLACRSEHKARMARDALMIGRPNATITVLLVDIGDLKSVYAAANEFRSMYKRLDYIYLNAGIMPGAKVDWKAFWSGLFSKDSFHMFATGHGLLTQEDDTTHDGLKHVFATNVFGHFVLVKELQGLMGGASGPTVIVWTSSSNAEKSTFSIDDIQHLNGKQPYSSSKYASDLLSVSLNEELNTEGIYSFTTCPGMVLTNMTHGILPKWFWTIFYPFLLLVRFFVPSMTIEPFYGAEALFWLSEQRPETLDPLCKYHSQVSLLGTTSVGRMKMNISTDDAKRLHMELSALNEKFKKPF